MLSLLTSLMAPPKPEAAGPFVEAAPQRAWKPLSLRPDLLLFCLMNTTWLGFSVHLYKGEHWVTQ